MDAAPGSATSIAGPLLLVTNSTIALDGNVFQYRALLDVFPSASISIGGPVLRATNGTQVTMTGDAIGIFEWRSVHRGQCERRVDRPRQQRI